MQRLVIDLIRRKRYYLLAFILACVGYALFHGSVQPSTNPCWLWLCILPHHLNFEIKPSSRSVDVYNTLPLSRRTYMRSRWVVVVALPVATASAIFLTALLAGATLGLRECVLVVGTIMIVAGMSFITAGMRTGNLRARRKLILVIRLIPWMAIYMCLLCLPLAPPAQHFVLGSTPILTILALGGLVSVERSFRRCDSVCKERSFQTTEVVPRKPGALPRFIPKWRAPLIFVETAGWATAWIGLAGVLFMAFSGVNMDPVLIAALGSCAMLWVPVLFLARITNSSMRFMRTLPISRRRRLVLLWSPVTVIGVVFSTLGALVVALSGQNELGLRSSAAVCVIGLCWICFVVFTRVLPRLHEMHFVRGSLSVLLLVGLAAAYEWTILTVLETRDVQTDDFLRGVGGLAILACVFVFCELIADLGGRRRWTPRAPAAETAPDFSSLFVDPSRSVKRWTAACLIVMIALIPFMPKQGLLKFLLDHSKESASATQRK